MQGKAAPRRHNYDWAHCLESLRAYAETGAGKPINAGSNGG
jgi:hypothetical protein